MKIAGTLDSKSISKFSERLVCRILIDERVLLGQITSDMYEFEILENRAVRYSCAYCPETKYEKLFSYGPMLFYDELGIEIFRIVRHGFLKLKSQIILPDGSKMRLPLVLKSFSIPYLNFNINLKDPDFVSIAGNSQYFDLAICLSYYWWIRLRLSNIPS